MYWNLCTWMGVDWWFPLLHPQVQIRQHWGVVYTDSIAWQRWGVAYTDSIGWQGRANLHCRSRLTSTDQALGGHRISKKNSRGKMDKNMTWGIWFFVVIFFLQHLLILRCWSSSVIYLNFRVFIGKIRDCNSILWLWELMS